MKMNSCDSPGGLSRPANLANLQRPAEMGPDENELKPPAAKRAILPLFPQGQNLWNPLIL
jgi:hypothetical protein